MSLKYCETDTNFSALATRWNNTPTTSDVCAAMSVESSIQCDGEDYNLLSDRWNVGVPYFKVSTLSGVAYIMDCAYIDRIDTYMVSECSGDLLRSELKHFNDFIRYQDAQITRPDLIALDDLLVAMVISGSDCTTIQGANCG